MKGGRRWFWLEMMKRDDGGATVLFGGDQRLVMLGSWLNRLVEGRA